MSSPSNFANTTTANPAPIDLNVCDLWDASFIMNLAMTGIAVLAYGYFYFHKHLPVRDGVPSYSYPYTILFFLALLLWWQSVPNWAFFVTFYELSGSVAYGEAIACQGNTPPSVGFYLATLILLLALRMNPLDDSRIFGETYVANSPAIAANQPGKRPVNILFVGSANRGLVFAEATRVLLQKRAEGKTIILHVLNTTTDGNAEQHIRNNAFALNRHLLSGSPATTLPILSASSPTALSSSSALDAMLWGMDQNTLEPIQRGYVFRDEREMSSLNMCFDEVWISPRFRDTLASFFMKDEEKSRRLKALVSYVVRRHTVVGASVVYIDKCLGALAAAEDLRETTFFHVNDVSPYAVMQDQREAFDRQSLPDANGRVGGGIKVPTTVVMGILEGVETSAPSFRKRTKMFMVQAVVTRTAPLYTPEALVQVTDGACTLDVLMTTSPANVPAPVVVPSPPAIWVSFLVMLLQCSVFVAMCCLLPPSWSALAVPERLDGSSSSFRINNVWLSSVVRCYPMAAFFCHTGLFEKLGDASLPRVLVSWVIGDGIAILVSNVFVVLTSLPSFIVAIILSYVSMSDSAREAITTIVQVGVIVGLVIFQQKWSRHRLFIARGFDPRYKAEAR